MTTPLEEHLQHRTKDLNELLDYSRQAIADCTESTEIAQDQARQVIATIRQFLCSYERDNPVHSVEIQQWWKEVSQSLIHSEHQQQGPDVVTQTQKRLDQYEVRLQHAWGVSSRDLLQSKYTPKSGFPKKTLQALVLFAERSSCEAGQAALEEALTLRLQSDDDRPYRTREPYLVPSDIDMAEGIYESKQPAPIENANVSTRRKRKRVAEEDKVFSIHGQASESKASGSKRACISGAGRPDEQDTGIDPGVGRSIPKVTPPKRDTTHSEDADSNEGLKNEGIGEKPGQHTPPHEEGSMADQSPGSYYRTNGVHENKTIDNTLKSENKTHQVEPPRDGASNGVQGFESDSGDQHSQSSPHTKEPGGATEYEENTTTSVEIGRGMRSSLELDDQHKLFDDSSMLEGSLTPHAAEERSKMESPMLETPDILFPRQWSCMSPQQSTPKPFFEGDDQSMVLTQVDTQHSPMSATCKSVFNRRPRVRAFSPSPTGSQTVREEAAQDFVLDSPSACHSLRIAANRTLDQSPSAPGFTQRRKLPTTDLAGALSTLEPGQYLSASAIEHVLSTCCPESARVIDSACFSLDLSNASSRSLRPCGDQITKVLVPIHNKNHWTLAVLDRQARTITHYNSLSTTSSFKNGLGKALNRFMSNFESGMDGKKSLPLAYEELGTQDNSYDCGVHVLVTALCTFVNSAPLKSADTKLWRLIFRALLTEQVQTEPQLEGLTDKSEDTGVEGLGVDVESHKARFTTCKLRVAHAESTLDLLNQISSQITASTLKWSKLPDICQRFLSSIEGGISELSPFKSVFESLPNVDQCQALLEAGRNKGDKICNQSMHAEKSLQAAIGSAQKSKDIRIEDKRRLCLRLQRTADATRKKGQQQLEAAKSQIMAAEQLHLLTSEE